MSGVHHDYVARVIYKAALAPDAEFVPTASEVGQALAKLNGHVRVIVDCGEEGYVTVDVTHAEVGSVSRTPRR
jgi:hypothetical protein